MKHFIWAAVGAAAMLLEATAGRAMIPVSKTGDDVTTFTTIAGALAVAGAGEEVRVVDQGTYTEALTLSDVKLTAVPAGATISADSPAGNRLIHLTGTQPVEISGFNMFVTTQGHGLQIDADTVPQVSISNGEVVAPWAGVQLFVNTGSAITQLSLANVSIHDCSVGLDAQGSGSGGYSITVDGVSSISNNWTQNINCSLGGTLTLNGATVSNCGSGPGMQLGEAGNTVLTATSCTLSNNAQDGVLGVVNPGAATGTTWTLTGCVLSGNGQSAVQVYSNENQGLTVEASRCQFVHGVSGEPLLDLFKANANLVNCLLDHGGDTTNGNMVLLRYSGGEQATFEHCTLVSTNASVNALSLVDGGSAVVTGCIIEAAGAALNIWPASGPVISHDYNLLRGLLNNTSASAHEVIDQDPLFMEASSGAGTGDFHLQEESAAVAAGQAADPVTVDLDGNPRPLPAGSPTDLGCFESVFFPAELSAFTLN